MSELVKRVSADLTTAMKARDTAATQALRMIREQRPEVITLDVIMPGMDGWEVLRTLKADPELRDIPVILLTARVNGETPDDAVAGVIAKPFDPMRLGTEVSRLLGWVE